MFFIIILIVSYGYHYIYSIIFMKYKIWKNTYPFLLIIWCYYFYMLHTDWSLPKSQNYAIHTQIEAYQSYKHMKYKQIEACQS